MATSNAPLSIGTVTLRAKNRSKLASFYESAIGLRTIFSNSESHSLGVGDRVLINLQEDRNAKIRPTEAGLFHTAFLLPEREQLGAWLKHATDTHLRLDGASDHGVSEAVYLQDPEGNGIEMYTDRSKSEWDYDGGNPKPSSGPLDIRGLVGLAQDRWELAPLGTVIGHVHLQVGDIDESNEFYSDEIGFSIVNEMQQASFYSTGGYHHHIAGNTWRSRNAGKRLPDSTGLVEFELLAAEHHASNIGKTYTDPWGTHVRFSSIH